MTSLHKLTRSLPFILSLAIASAAIGGQPALEIDQPAPAVAEKVQVSGVCAKAGEAVKFSLMQSGEKRDFTAVGETTEETFTQREGGFATDLDLAEVQAKPGVATLTATCADGKTLATDLRIGVQTSTAGASTSLADDARGASLSTSDNGRGANELTIDSKTPPTVGQKIIVGGKCPVEDGVVSFTLQQNGKTFKFGDLSLSSGVTFRKKLDLKKAEASQGKAKLIATCPGGKVISRDIDIAQ